MISIFKKIDDSNWQLIEELHDDLVLVQRLIELRSDGGEYRAEKKNSLGSTILDD